MVTKSIADKSVALAIVPALALGLFASPALAFWGPAGVTTNISVTNNNAAVVMNEIQLETNTGYNTADGGNGAKGGNSGDSGDDAGNGGDGGEGGEGGKAEAKGGYAEGGDGGYGYDGGAGGDTGNTGKGGNGGNGGEGGSILTGDASAGAAISNQVNTNHTDIEVEDCGCDQYNEKFESADEYFMHYSKDRDDRRNKSRRGGNGGDEKLVESESHWEEYSKTFVPVTTNIDVDNNNLAMVGNGVADAVNTGDNVTDGGDAGKGGNSGDSGSDAGDGGEGAEGGEGGKAESGSTQSYGYKSYHHGGHGSDSGSAFGGDGGDGGFGAEGGDTGTTGHAGNGGDGGQGGVIVTGYADSAAAIVNVVNQNITRIRR